MKICWIDFEFNRTKEPQVNLVCVALSTTNPPGVWLHKTSENDFVANSAREDLKAHLLSLRDQGWVFASYSVEAEARSFLALGIDPTTCQWLDLYIIYRLLLNQNNKLAYGKQLLKGKIVRTLPPLPKYMLSEEERLSRKSHSASASLASAAYKLLDVIIDTAHKTEMRDLIISDPEKFTPSEKRSILEYCVSDIQHLPAMLEKMVEIYRGLIKKELTREEILGRFMHLSEFSAHVALDVSTGYPVNIEWLSAIEQQYKKILWSVARDINRLFPEVSPFTLNKFGKPSMSKAPIKKWIKDQRLEHKWLKTEKKDLSLKEEAFSEHFPYKHSYPRNCFGAQMLRYLKMQKHLKGFLRKEGKDETSIWDSIGSDGRVRPYINHFGSQTSRNQPSSTSFIPLKPAWMRCMIVPPPGKAICVADFKSEEILIAALNSKDKKMLAAYASGDPYMYFAKEAKAVPRDATKKSHPEIREKFKHTTLGMSYLISKYGLAPKLSIDLGHYVSIEEAQELIEQFDNCYPDYYEYKELLPMEYSARGYLELADHWAMWGNNINNRSVVNFPSQGTGGVILRESVKLSHKKNLRLPYTLHDAIAIEIDVGDYSKIDDLNIAMKEGFKWPYRKDKWRHERANVGIDFKIWSLDFPEEDGYITTPGGIKVPSSKYYIDERAVEEFNFFKQFFKVPNYLKRL